MSGRSKVTKEDFLIPEAIRKEVPLMPYYIYALQAGSKINRLCGSFADYQGAEICERDNQRSANSDDVIMIYAENKTHALQRIKQIRREKGLLKK